MDPNLWNGLKSSQAASRTGVVSGPELAFSLQPSLAQPAINSTVNFEILALLDRQQRIAAASGLTAGFLPQPAILTPSYGTSTSFGGQYAATNNLYQYNTLPVGQPVLTTSYDSGNLLSNQQQELSKNVSLTTTASLYIATSLTQQLTTSSSTIASNVTLSSKADATLRVKKPVSYSFVGDQPSRSVSNMENNIGLGLRLDAVRMNTAQIPSLSSSLSQSGFVSSDLAYGHILDSATSHSSVHSAANGCQTTLRPTDSSRLVLAPSDFSFDQLSANLCLNLSQFSKSDSKTYGQNFQPQDFTVLNAESLLSLGQPCELMSAVNMSSNKETVALNTSHSQQAKQHEMANTGLPLSWATTAQYCEQQNSSSSSRNIGGGGSSANVPAMSYEAVSPPPSTETQSLSFGDSLHLYSEGLHVKDLLSSAHDLTENQIYVKNLYDIPLMYASQASGSDGNSQVSAAFMPLSFQAVTPNDGSSSSLGKTKHSDMLVNKPAESNRENAPDRGRRQKSKLTTEVGVVLPMPQNKLAKSLSSNPLIADFESPSSSENRQQSAYEMIHYGGDLTPLEGRHLLYNYKTDAQKKMTSPDVVGHGKQSGLATSVSSGRNEMPSDAHNSPIVLTNITGNVYVNQYTMLPPGSVPLINQDMSYQPVAHYDPTGKVEQDKMETKSCSVLLVPNEHDDEFGHLSADPFAIHSASHQPADGASGISQSVSVFPTAQISSSTSSALQKAKAVNSAFENSYVNFVHGHKSETLSSVTNSPIKNKPVLPKYIPEVRRPRTDIEKFNVETVVSAGNRKSNVTSSNAAAVVCASKAGSVETVVTSSSHSEADSVSIASSFASANTTKFPPKFSHKLLCKAQLLNDSAKTNNIGAAEKETSEVMTKIAHTDSNKRSRGNVISPVDTPSSQLSKQGPKRKLSTATESSNDGSAVKALQVQWTVSKKSKIKKSESSDIPILVIKAVSSNSTDEKCSSSSGTKPVQSENFNSAGAKGNDK